MVYWTLYWWFAWALTIGLFVVEMRALLDAITRTPRDFVAAGKKSQQFWLLLLVGSVLLGLMGMPFFRGSLILSVLCVIPAGVYLADVAPEMPRRRRS